jgi:periplasmic binding family protein
MDWLSPENLLAVLGLLATVGVLAYERLIPGLKRIGYRVQMDTPIGGDARNGQPDVRLGLFGETPEMSDASLVLLRIENDGLRGISADDYTSRQLTGLTVSFTDRTVTGVAVTEPSHSHLMSHFTAYSGLRQETDVISVPKVPLNKGEHFKLLVLLTGSGVGRPVTVSGGLKDGAVKRNRKQPRPSNRVLGLVTFLALLLVLEPLMLTLGDRTPVPLGCARGELRVTGSTAFAPALKSAARAYEKECTEARITVEARGSMAGIRALDAAGSASKDAHPAQLTLSDGPTPGRFTKLSANRVAVAVFALRQPAHARRQMSPSPGLLYLAAVPHAHGGRGQRLTSARDFTVPAVASVTGSAARPAAGRRRVRQAQQPEDPVRRARPPPQDQTPDGECGDRRSGPPAELVYEHARQDGRAQCEPEDGEQEGADDAGRAAHGDTRVPLPAADRRDQQVEHRRQQDHTHTGQGQGDVRPRPLAGA